MKSVRDMDIAGRKVLVRVDYNLPMDDNQRITDDNRIRATLPLIHYLLDKRARIILASHMGRPCGKRVETLSLAPAARSLSELLGQEVGFVHDCIGKEVESRVDSLGEGEILLLENLRFHKGEKSNDRGFAEKLARLCDVYVNNAFSVSHRKQASVVAVAGLVPEAAAGFLLEKEISCYNDSVKNPTPPLVAIVGGAKVSSKLEALENMLEYVNVLIIGGAMANTFLASQGVDLGASLIEEDLKDTAAGIMDQAAARGIRLLLPKDLVVAAAFDKDAEKKRVKVDEVPSGWMGLDIGPETAAMFSEAVGEAGTIVWNGPMGVFEMAPFREGTQAVADAVAASSAFSIVGGGDTGSALKVCKRADEISYISTGGGAFLHLMEGKTLPGAEALA